jgi:hypothetical protein
MLQIAVVRLQGIEGRAEFYRARGTRGGLRREPPARIGRLTEG